MIECFENTIDIMIECFEQLLIYNNQLGYDHNHYDLAK